MRSKEALMARVRQEGIRERALRKEATELARKIEIARKALRGEWGMADKMAESKPPRRPLADHELPF